MLTFDRLSFWEKRSVLEGIDALIVGSGIVGMTTAIHLKKKDPKKKIVILERGYLPSGASTKNAGFACFGSLTEILDDFWSMTPDEVLQLVEKRYSGLTQIRKQFGDKALRYQHRNGYEILVEEQVEALEQLDSINHLLKKIFKKEVFSQVKDPSKFGFSEQVKAVVKNRFEGELDPGAYLNALWEKASHLGIRIISGLTVVEVDHEGGRVLAEKKDKKEDVEVSEFQSATNELFKLGKLPSEHSEGPHLDPGKTLQKAMSALDPKTISSMTTDTKQLIETQKGLMSMLSQMRPVLADGKELLQTFTSMFGNGDKL